MWHCPILIHGILSGNRKLHKIFNEIFWHYIKKKICLNNMYQLRTKLNIYFYFFFFNVRNKCIYCSVIVSSILVPFFKWWKLSIYQTCCGRHNYSADGRQTLTNSTFDFQKWQYLVEVSTQTNNLHIPYYVDSPMHTQALLINLHCCFLREWHIVTTFLSDHY